MLECSLYTYISTSAFKSRNDQVQEYNCAEHSSTLPWNQHFLCDLLCCNLPDGG